MRKLFICFMASLLTNIALASPLSVPTLPRAIYKIKKPDSSLSDSITWVNYENHIDSKKLVNAALDDSQYPLYICQSRYGELGVHPGQAFTSSHLKLLILSKYLY